MNKSIFGVVAVVAVGGVALFVMMNSAGQRSAGEQPASSTDINTMAPKSEPTSLASLMQLGAPQKCTFSNTQSGVSFSGAVYMASGKVRTNTISAVASTGQTTKTHMILNGGYRYVWTDGSVGGIKSATNAADTAAAYEKSSSGVNLNQNLNYVCASWAVDQSVFVLPADVQFKDVTEMMQGAGSSTATSTPSISNKPFFPDTSAPSPQCSTCDTITDPQIKAQCKAALNCM